MFALRNRHLSLVVLIASYSNGWILWPQKILAWEFPHEAIPDSPAHYVQIRPPETPLLRIPRSGSSETVSEQAIECRDLISFYKNQLFRRNESYQRSLIEYQKLQDARVEHRTLERAINQLQGNLNRNLGSEEVQRIQQRIQQLQQQQASIDYSDKVLEERLRQEKEAFEKLQDARLAAWNEEALDAVTNGKLEQATKLMQSMQRRAKELELLDVSLATQSNLAVLQEMQGNYVNALAEYKQVIELEKTSGRLRQQVTSLLNIGRVYEKLGSYQNALQYYNQALKASQREKFAVAESIALSSQGFLFNRQGNYPAALKTLKQARAAIAPNALDPKAAVLHQEEVILSGIGFAYLKSNQLQPALEAYNQALTASQSCNNKRAEAIALNGLGNVKQAQVSQDPNQASTSSETALSHYQASLKLQQELNNRPGQAETYRDMAAWFENNGQPELAIVLYKRAVQILEGIRQHIELLPIEQQQDYTESVTVLYRNLADLLSSQNRILESQQILDLLKFQELDEYLNDVRQQRELYVGDSEQQILQQFNAALTQASSLSSMGQNPIITAQIKQIQSDVKSQKIDQDLLSGLQDDIRRMDPKGALLYPLISQNHLQLILIPATGKPIQEPVYVSQQTLQSEIKSFQKTLKNKRLDPLPPAKKLYEWLIEPLEKHLEDQKIETLIYSPDGQLRYIPLAALFDGNQWLVQRFRINQITAASVTDWETSRTESTNPAVLAAAIGKDGPYEVHIEGRKSVRYSKGLEYAQDEVDNIAGQIINTTQLLGQDFTLASVTRRVVGQNIVHFATHGKFIDGDPEESFILMENSEHANLRQIGSWDLSSANLVVFSACETAVSGDDSTGQEILGLGYQVQRAGARAAIASLWKVDDKETLKLMKKFYELRQQGMTQVEALQQAQINFIPSGDEPVPKAMLTEGSAHPHYWAAFILIGNGF